MEKKKFSDKRWNEYQDVKILNIKKELTEEDKQKAKEFRKYIDKKIKKEKNN